MAIHSPLGQPLPADTEARLANFTELVATAIANAESRAELARLAQEQAALRRVATLVARGTPPEKLFAAVAEQVGQLLDTHLSGMARPAPCAVPTRARRAAAGWRRADRARSACASHRRRRRPGPVKPSARRGSRRSRSLLPPAP
jgi:GAF domain-containing protein